jgi:hypothetical protein
VHRRRGGARRSQQDGGLVNLKAFFVATLQSALDLGIASPDDVIRHVTPDVLAAHLPRPLWARLLTACVGAPRVDAQLVVETIGVPNLCEHVPAQIIWGSIEELAVRSLGGSVSPSAVQTPASAARPPAAAGTPAIRPVPLAPPPPPAASEPKGTVTIPPAAVGPSIPVPGTPAEAEIDAAGRPRTAAGQRFRQSSTGMGRVAATASARRPQAQATPAAAAPATEPNLDRGAGVARAKRGQTEADFDLETFVGGKDDWKNALAVEDEQLVDWSAAEETAGSADEIGRKR